MYAFGKRKAAPTLRIEPNIWASRETGHYFDSSAYAGMAIAIV